jgi:hypothetical protein
MKQITDYNPVEYLIKIQRLKLKAVLIPLGIIIVSFAINILLKIDLSKYFSLFGLMLYILISLRYRIQKNIPPDIEQQILSPINGKITQINKDRNEISIKKSFFHPAEIRSPSNDDTIKFNINSRNFSLFEERSEVAGKLIGIVPSNAECTINITGEYEININPGQKVIAGETIIAEKINNISNSS